MDHNLDLDNSSGVNFAHAEDNVISEVDIGLGHIGEDIPMEFEHTIEEQPLLMESGNEEIIVSDYIGSQFTLQEYSGSDEPSTGSNDFQISVDMATQNEVSTDFNIQNIQSAPKTVVSLKPKKYITVKTADLVNKTSTVPRPVAIAPKPSKCEAVPFKSRKPIVIPSQAIAPKPSKCEAVPLESRKPIVIPSQGIMGAPKTAGKHVLTSIQNAVIKQATTYPKLKLVTSGGNLQYAQIIPAKTQLLDQSSQNTENTGNVVTKIFVQGQQSTDIVNQTASASNVQSAAKPSRLVAFQQKLQPGTPVTVSTAQSQQIQVLTNQFVAIKSPKTLLTGQLNTDANQKASASNVQSAAKTSRLVFQQTPAGEFAGTPVVVSTSPSQQKHQIKVPANQFVAIKSPKTGSFAKKFIITGNSAIKSIATTKNTETIVTSGSSKTQFHQVNVPGKGIQYIQISKPDYKTKKIVIPAKNVVVNKGGLSMNEKVVTAGPPPLVFTGNAPINKLTGKPQQKLVRIAPLGSKTAQAFLKARASQSLLAPMKIEKDTDSQDTSTSDVYPQLEQEMDSKHALSALIADTVTAGNSGHTLVHQKVEVEFEAQETEEADISLDTHDYSAPDFSMSRDYQTQNYSDQDLMRQADYDNSNSEYATSPEAPLIVIPSNYVKQHEAEVPITNLEDVQLEYPETVFTDPRPRKACNCTKSQCLKLYCDCFANGEFCNNCNCINCHNNLTHEELRQKAIRGCLERNPNAFRPKIGKGKGGIDIVRRHNKGCNCKRSGCLKNYCECFEAKIACSANCKCVGCRNIADSLEGVRRCEAVPRRLAPKDPMYRPPNSVPRQPCSFMSTEVVEAVCQCLIAAATEADSSNNDSSIGDENSGVIQDPIRNVIEEFSRCLQDIIGAAHQPEHVSIFDETHA